MAEIGTIGDIVFQASSSLVRTFNEFSDSVSSRLGAHEVAGVMPVIEYIGPGTRELSFAVQLNSSLGVDVEADIKRAQDYCQAGRLLSIIIGGKQIGGAGAKWIIESVDAERLSFGRKGETLLADMKLSVKQAQTASTPKTISQSVQKSNTKKVKVVG